MKKERLKSFVKVLAFAIALIVAATAVSVPLMPAQTVEAASKKKKKKKIAISSKRLTVTIGQKKTLKLKNVSKKEAKKIKWKSKNKKVASVNRKGVVYAKKVGKTTITATYKGKKYKCVVTVQNNSYIYISNPNQTLLVGSTLDNGGTSVSLGYTIYYPQGTAAPEVTWSSSNPSVASVSSTGTVKAISRGTAVITAQLPNGAKTTATITVKHIDIYLQSFPQSFSYSSSIDGEFFSSCDITGVDWYVNYRNSSDSFSIQATVYGNKTGEGETLGDGCRVGYKLYDSYGYVVETGWFAADNISLGERFKATSYVSPSGGVSEGDYYLVLTDFEL